MRSRGRPEAGRPGVGAIALLSLGHLVVDLYQSVVPALLPVWKQAFGLPYAAAGGVVLAMQVASSVVQPVFGVVGDRFADRHLLPGAILMAAAGMAAAAIAPSYGLAVACVLVGGLGVALYHPEGSRRAHEHSGPLRATSMSWFSVGGNLGMGLGPLVVAGLSAWGSHALAAGLAGIGAAAAASMWAGRRVVAGIPERRERPGWPGQALRGESDAPRPGADPSPPAADRWGGLWLLAAVVHLRSSTHAAVQAFVPLLLTAGGMDVARAQAVLGLFLLAGAAGTLVAGPAADLFGRRPVIVGSMVLSAPLVWLVGHAPPQWVPLGLAVLGFVLASTFSVTIVLAQELLPNHVSTASGIILGVTVGTGGIGAVLLGWLADAVGIGATLSGLVALPLLGAMLASRLPQDRAVQEGRPLGQRVRRLLA